MRVDFDVLAKVLVAVCCEIGAGEVFVAVVDDVPEAPDVVEVAADFDVEGVADIDVETGDVDDEMLVGDITAW